MGSRAEDIKTPVNIASYTRDLFTARERENGTKGYGVTFIFDKEQDLSKLHQNALEAAEAEWPGKPVREWIKDGTIKSPFLDGDSKQGRDQEGNQRPELKGKTFIRCTSGENFPPKVFGRNGVSRITDPSEIPSGSKTLGVVNAFAWENKKNGKGISFGVSIVQLHTKAEGAAVLGGSGSGPDPEKFLEKLSDEGDAPAETKSGAGAGGLFG
jgi:hypothetical protein